MSHNHHSHNISVNLAFIIGIGLNIAYVIFEAAAGLIYDSTALLSDAGHNFSDVLSLLLGALSVYLLGLKPKKRLTYGFRKTTILAAFINSLLLIMAVGIIGYESIRKLLNPEPINANVVVWVALLGIFINTLTALFFTRWTKHDLNIRAVFWHMIADALVSVGVVIAGLIMKWTGWYGIDGLIGIIIGIIILYSTWDLLRESFLLSIDAVPQNVDENKIIKAIEAHPDVQSVHHVHIWAMSTTENALTAHVVVKKDFSLNELMRINRELQEILKKHGISHTTLEFETPEGQCQTEC